MKVFESLSREEKFVGESVVNKNMKVATMWLLAGVAIGFLILEIVDFVEWMI